MCSTYVVVVVVVVFVVFVFQTQSGSLFNSSFIQGTF